MVSGATFAGATLDAEGAVDGVVANTVLAAAPTINGGTIPSAALWWDGFTIAKNISDEDAEASFRALAARWQADLCFPHTDVAVFTKP